jgi:hypothetical protein
LKGWIKERPHIPTIPVQKQARPIIPTATLERFLEAVDACESLHASFLVRAQLLMGMRNHEARLMKWSGFRREQKVFIPERRPRTGMPP